MLLICVWMVIPPVFGVTQPIWSNPGWAGITVVLLLEPTAGATLAKTVLRVAGTVLGACFSALLLEALHVSSAVTDAVLVCCVLPPFCALCAYCKACYKPYAYLWTVCSLTPTIVVLFSFEEHEQQRWYFAAYRCFNIVVGALVVLATAKIPPLAVRPPRLHPPGHNCAFVRPLLQQPLRHLHLRSLCTLCTLCTLPRPLAGARLLHNLPRLRRGDGGPRCARPGA